MGTLNYKPLNEDRRYTFKCDTRGCWKNQRGTELELYQAGWMRIFYRITLAEVEQSGFLTERVSKLVCPDCARSAITETQDALEDWFQRSPAKTIQKTLEKS